VAAIFWFVLWFFVVSSGPDKDKWITETEKVFIMESLKGQKSAGYHLKTPWKSIFTSLPVYAITMAVKT
jgi:hypothetical protein